MNENIFEFRRNLNEGKSWQIYEMEKLREFNYIFERKKEKIHISTNTRHEVAE